MGDMLRAAVRDGIIDALVSVWEAVRDFILASGDQALFAAAMFGLVFWGLGSRTAGRVVGWSILLFTLAKIFDIYAYGFFVALVAIKYLTGR